MKLCRNIRETMMLFEEYDFSGKTIVPFTTHGGSGFSRNSVKNAQSDVVDWVEGLDIIQ